MRCPRCPHENPAGQKFCGDCGTPLRQLEGIAQSTSSDADLERFLTEARDQQTATAEILRVIGTSPTDAHPVFEAIACSGVQVCGALSCAVFVVDGEMLHLAATHGVPAARIERFRSQFPAPLTSPEDATRAVRERSIFHMADIENNPAATPGQIHVARLGGYCTRLMVPMLRGDNALGLIAVTSAAPTPFPERQVALLQTFADQAVIAIENVRLFNELKARNHDLTESLEQQTATSDILRVISSSPTDVQPVFTAIAQRAMRLCDGNFCNVVRYDGDLLHLAAQAHVTAEALEAMKQIFPTRPSRSTVVGRVVLETAVVHLPDVQRDTEFNQPLAAAFRGRSVLGVPLLRDGQPIGAIVVGRSESHPFTDNQIGLLKTFADQAVIAVENVRLFKELEARNRELTTALDTQTATSEILRTIAQAQTDVQPVFDTIVQSAARLCHAVNAAVFLTDGRMVHHPANYRSAPEALAGARARYPRPLDMNTMPGMVILTRSVVHVPDIEEPSAVPLVREIGRFLGFRSTVAVPMLREGEAIGSINVARREPGRFSDAEVELLRTFADQAVIAIENVRLFTELQQKNGALTQAHAQVTEALEQQTATSDILRVISQSQTDAQPVFETIVRNAVRLCGAIQGGVYRFDGELVHAVAHEGFTPQQLQDWRRNFPRPVTAPGGINLAIRTRTVVRIDDIEVDPSIMSTVTVANLRSRGSRSTLAVPMIRQGDIIGAIALAHREVAAFSNAHVELLKTFADQAVIAIENVRLFKELEARTQELTRSVGELRALGEVGQAISSTLDLETVLTTIVSRAVQLSGLDGGVVFEYEEETEEFVHRAATETGGALAEARRTTRVRKGEGVVGRTAITLEPAQVPDITVPGAHESRLRENLIESGIRAVLAVPMVREGRLIGSLVVSRNRPGDFPAETIELLRTFATQSALAIQNARLFREIEDKSRQLEAASRHKSEFLANMSHELRTPLNAVIGFSEVLLQRMFGALNDKQDEYLKDIYASGQHLLSLINDILDLSKIEAGRMELAPAPFHLPTALENGVTLVKERAGRHGIALQLDIDPRLGELVGDERKVKQVLLNLLSNAVKFTPEGGRISLKARRKDGAVEIAVTDTGIGIASEDQAAIFEEFRQVGSDETRKQEGTGLGLTLAKKFVELHGGRLWVESEPGRGSTFTFTLPVGPWPARSS
jgi:GAF domain-containing protein/anti-sigma regulatory factor (Ser/Thr protein kinase)